MAAHPLSGKTPPRSMLSNIPRLVSLYYSGSPDTSNPEQMVSFGTSGHRGSSLKSSFNESHIMSITQAICLHRKASGINGPLFIGMDTHALSEPALATALEVLAANGVETRYQAGMGYTPTPVISHAILGFNRRGEAGKADGIVVTPSHNPPDDGGIKYNPPSGGPADTSVTQWIADKANELLRGGCAEVKRITLAKALKASNVRAYDYVQPYVDDLSEIIDMPAVKAAGLKLGVDALGGAGFAFWPRIAERYGIDFELRNDFCDPTFSFMRVDKDGKIRMDCSSPAAMAGLIELKDKYDIAFGNDPDYDRHGIVTRSSGLMNPNHYLATAVDYLFQNRPGWRPDAAVGKTLVSSSMIDRVAKAIGRRVCEVPVGFKFFVDGLSDGSFGFGGEESAGASFLRKDGTVWTTDKDGFVMDLLAAEITARTGKDPGEHYQRLVSLFGDPVYERMDAPADSRRRAALARLSPEHVAAETLAGERIQAKLTKAPGNGASIGGLKVVAENGWFAARPSGTEDVYKIYVESFLGKDHLERIKKEAQEIVSDAFKASGV